MGLEKKISTKGGTKTRKRNAAVKIATTGAGNIFRGFRKQIFGKEDKREEHREGHREDRGL